MSKDPKSKQGLKFGNFIKGFKLYDSWTDLIKFAKINFLTWAWQAGKVLEFYYFDGIYLSDRAFRPDERSCGRNQETQRPAESAQAGEHQP